MTAKKQPAKKKPRRNNKPKRDLAGAAETLPIWPKPRHRELRSADVFARPLRFTPYAWGKLLFLRDLGGAEVGGFGISSEDDLFLIEDFQLIKQICTQVTVTFEDEAVADFFEDQVELGREPERFARCWIHTHPGQSADPSGTDEETFARVFGGSSWSVMFILAKGGETYARLKFGCGPGAELTVPVEIAWDVPFAGTDIEAWEAEYDRCVMDLDAIPIASSNRLGPDDPRLLADYPELADWDFYPMDWDLFETERSMALEDNNDVPFF